MECWEGAGSADVVMVVLRTFEGDDATHHAPRLDAAADLAYVARLCKHRDVQVLRTRIRALQGKRGGEWLKAEKECLLRAVALLTRVGRGPEETQSNDDDSTLTSNTEPIEALRLEHWSDDEVGWLSKLDLMTNKPWVVAVNVECRQYLMRSALKEIVGHEDPETKRVERVALSLEISPSEVAVFSAAFEERVQRLREAPTMPPAEAHLPTVAPYDASFPRAREFLFGSAATSRRRRRGDGAVVARRWRRGGVAAMARQLARRRRRGAVALRTARLDAARAGTAARAELGETKPVLWRWTVGVAPDAGKKRTDERDIGCLEYAGVALVPRTPKKRT